MSAPLPPSLPLHPAAVSSARSGAQSGALRASHSVFVARVRLIRSDITGGQGGRRGEFDGGGGRVELVLGPLQHPKIEAASRSKPEAGTTV